MARGGGGRGGHSSVARRAVDLTGCISAAERNDLATLINAITERMHNDISTIFDSPPVSPVMAEDGHHWLKLPLLHRRAKENTPPNSNTYQNAGRSSDSYNRAHKSIEKEEKEAMTPHLRELKKEALTFFRKWQASVLQRIRDISVTVQDPMPAQGALRGRGRGASTVRSSVRGGRSARGGRASRGGALTLATGKRAHLQILVGG